MKYAFTILTVLFAATPVYATSWRQIAESDLGTIVWIDDDTTRQGGGYSAGWIRMQSVNKGYTISLIAARCESKTYMTLKATDYEPSGKNTVLDSVLEKKWEFPVPDSLMDAAIDAICSK